ncbi:MAG: restriction endonuclease subunit S [Oscillospiraceae bacterium]|nr:restriction endonuclease subunit S [Oscillospiraceae bacterium]
MVWADYISLEYGKPVKDKESSDGPVPVYGTNGQIGTSHQPPLCKIPSFIVGRKGAYRGVHYSPVPFSVIDTAFYALPLTDKVNMKWAYYKFLTYDINRMDSGSAIPSTDRYELYKIPVEIPDMDIQRKIVAVLDSFNEKIATNVAINANLLLEAGAVFDKAYEESSNTQPFTSLINVLGGGTPKTGNPDFWDGAIPFFTPKDVGAPYTFQTEKYITESGLDHCNSRLYQKDTTFVTARGTVGKVSLAGTPMAMNQSCYALASETIDPLLVYFYVLKAVASLKHKASGAVFDAIVTRDFDSETINILSDDDSNAVLSIIKPMMETIHNNSAENMRLAALRDSLLPRLMSGELDVSGLDI